MSEADWTTTTTTTTTTTATEYNYTDTSDFQHDLSECQQESVLSLESRT